MTTGVTMIIAAYNAEATIARAIASALAESKISQVIVVDDASTDDTVAIAGAQDKGNGRLLVIEQPANAGPSAARNRALAAASSPWIGILDADDFLLPGRIAGLLKFCENADLVADNLWQVDEAAIDGPRRLLLQDEPPREIGFDEFVLSNVTRHGRQRGEMGFIKPIMRVEFLMQHGLRYREEMRLGEDFELYARALALGGRLMLVPAQGYVSVVRANSLSGQHSAADLLALRNSDAALLRAMDLPASGKAALRRHARSIDCRLQWRYLIEAIKQRNLKAALATFCRPWPVPLYLARQLGEQFYLRILKR